MTKICNKCKIEKPADQFQKNNRSPSGLHHYCRPCMKEISAAYYVKNGERIRAKHRQWYQDNREHALAYANSYNAAEGAGTLETFGVGRGKYERTYREGCAPDLHDTPESLKSALNHAQFKVQVDRARLFIQEYKNAHFCTDCRKSFHFSAMDFDHLSDDKEFCIGEGVRHGYSVRRLKKEMAKCELVCSNCHRLRTWLRLTGGDLAQCQLA
jgi:hypothetical protein